MEVNIVSQTAFELNATQNELFQALIQKTKEVLKLNTEYVLSVVFVDDAAIHEINRDYRGIDRPTDVISFALLDQENDYETMGEDVELGDIFINIDAVHRQSESYGHSFDRELCFLLVHGLLHLLGYDHMNEEEEAEMFSLQDGIIDEIIKK